MAKNDAVRNACKQAVQRLRQADISYRTQAINALQPIMAVYANGSITAEEYEAATGETYAQTLHRQFSVELANAKDRAMAESERGKITEGELAELLARYNAAGCPGGSTLADTVTIPPEIPDDQEEAPDADSGEVG